MSQYDYAIPAERIIDPAHSEPFDFAALAASLRPAWMADAACQPGQGDLFFPERGEDSDEAKRVCAGCTVRRECLTLAFDNNEQTGIWGGLSGKERRRLRRTSTLAAIADAPLPEITYTADAVVAANKRRTAVVITNHGTVAGYKAHRRNGEDACRPCKDAACDASRQAKARKRTRDAIAETDAAIGPRRTTGRILEVVR